MYYEKYQKIRDEKKLKDRDVAVATGIDPATFSHWKKGLYTPRSDKLNKIAQFLNVDVNDILCDKANKPNSMLKNIFKMFGLNQ